MRIHILSKETNTSLCNAADPGDQSITLEQALDPESDSHFDCVACHKILTGA